MVGRAVIATLILFWNIYKWAREGTQTRATVKNDMHILGDERREGKTVFHVRVSNVGIRRVTIEGISYVYFRLWWKWLRNDQDVSLLAVRPSLDGAYPTRSTPVKSGTALLANRHT